MITSSDNILKSGTATDTGKSGQYKDEEIKKVARQFEAMFTSYMLKVMNESVQRSDLVPKSMGEEFFNDMLMDKYAEKISEGKGLGMSDMLYRYLRNNQGEMGNYSGKIRDYNSQKSMNYKMMKYTAGNLGASASSTASRNVNSDMSSIEHLIRQSADQYGLEANLIKAVIRQESAGNPYAVSKAGAKGLMQLVDSTAEDMGVKNVFNSRDNINGGAKYLKKMMDRFNGDMDLALAAYNAGPEAVTENQGVPPYPETQDYVKQVKRYLDNYRQVEGGSK
ncbi:MAG: hypothetical protein A2293_02260 [Elusimicrobia bacterium RIFOXYB2_FULL_49_7]|nr:MAG: hypothetical protein A2293_02260 [Elusimicrobia bacterium RIFOXYB2_FULL_49_7]